MGIEEKIKEQRRLVFHGTCCTIIGCLAGLPYSGVVFREHAHEWGVNGHSLISGAAPFFIQLLMKTPGTERAWKMAHLEGLLNGMLGLLMASNFPALNLSVKDLKTLNFHIIFCIYANAIASIIAAVKEVRGLTLEGTLPNKIAAFLFTAAGILWSRFTDCTSEMINHLNEEVTKVHDNGNETLQNSLPSHGAPCNSVLKCESLDSKFSKVIEGIKVEGEISFQETGPKINSTASSPLKSMLQFNGTWKFISSSTMAMDFHYTSTSMLQVTDGICLDQLQHEIKWKGHFKNFAQGKVQLIPESFCFRRKEKLGNMLQLDGYGKNRFGDFHILVDWDLSTNKVIGNKLYLEKPASPVIISSPVTRNLYRQSSNSEFPEITASAASQPTIGGAKLTGTETRKRASIHSTTVQVQTFASSRKASFSSNSKSAEISKKLPRGRPRKSVIGEDSGVSKDSKSMTSEENISKSKPDSGSECSDENSIAEENDDIFMTLDTSLEERIPKRKRTGFGIKASKSGFMYEGQWYKGRKHGKGVVYDIRNPDNIQKIFQGEFVEDLITGIGTFLGENGDRYDGEWTDGSFNGFGEYFQSSENNDVEESQNYSGEWVSNVRHGIGKITLMGSKAYYEGTWENDMFHGQGTLNVPNKINFNGDFENGVMEGKGVCFYYSSHGEVVGKYDGGFKEGLRSGRGCYKFFGPGGVAIGEFEGRFKKDEMEGNNTIEVTENLPIILNDEEWVLPLKRQSEMKFIHHAAGFNEDGS